MKYNPNDIDLIELGRLQESLSATQKNAIAHLCNSAIAPILATFQVEPFDRDFAQALTERLVCVVSEITKQNGEISNEVAK